MFLVSRNSKGVRVNIAKEKQLEVTGFGAGAVNTGGGKANN